MSAKRQYVPSQPLFTNRSQNSCLNILQNYTINVLCIALKRIVLKEFCHSQLKSRAFSTFSTLIVYLHRKKSLAVSRSSVQPSTLYFLEELFINVNLTSDTYMEEGEIEPVDGFFPFDGSLSPLFKLT